MHITWQEVTHNNRESLLGKSQFLSSEQLVRELKAKLLQLNFLPRDIRLEPVYRTRFKNDTEEGKVLLFSNHATIEQLQQLVMRLELNTNADPFESRATQPQPMLRQTTHTEVLRVLNAPPSTVALNQNVSGTVETSQLVEVNDFLASLPFDEFLKMLEDGTIYDEVDEEINKKQLVPSVSTAETPLFDVNQIDLIHFQIPDDFHANTNFSLFEPYEEEKPPQISNRCEEDKPDLRFHPYRRP